MEKLVWKDEDNSTENRDLLDISDKDLYDRLFSFQVKQTDEEEESAAAESGFTVCTPNEIPASF